MYEKTCWRSLDGFRCGLSSDGGIEKLEQFQKYFSDSKIVLLDGLYPVRVMFSGNTLSEMKLYFLYDLNSGH